MKNFKIIKIYILWITLVATIINGCKKDETTSKIDSIISWENPADICYGLLLSGTQLNATADVPGTFFYTSPIGTELNEGANQDLKVIFSPYDGFTYKSAKKTVKINVTTGGVNSAIFNPNLAYGSLTDVEGNVYKTIIIGTQTWMAENLRTTKYRNGNNIPKIMGNFEWKSLNSDAYCNYNNNLDINKVVTLGRLYNWFAVSDNRNIAPVGWHVATDAEWTTLTAYLGGESAAGGKLKELGTSHWNSPNISALNSSGFTALPSGRREYDNGTFINLDYDCFWWTSSAYNPDYSWYRNLHYTFASINRANFHKQYGFSVRCVKD